MRTKCSKGHRFTPDNTFRRIDGKRGCITCRTEKTGVPLPIDYKPGPDRSTIESALETALNNFDCHLAECLDSKQLSVVEQHELRNAFRVMRNTVDSICQDPAPRVGDEVSVLVRWQSDSEPSYEDAEITGIVCGIVYVGFNYGEPYELKTGKSLFDHNFAELRLIFDNGWESQHYEDLFLGEGETL